MRPRSLDEYVGQEQLIGKGKLLRQAIERGELPSMILWGPPGTGKTTLAHVIAQSTDAHVERLSAVASGVADLKRVVQAAKDRRKFESRPTILFVDEIHRFNKSQQDALLPHVEDGTVTLVGATTENPSFEVNTALLSRARVYVLEPLDEESIASIVEAALLDKDRGLGLSKLRLDPEAKAAIIETADGDARIALTTLETAAASLSEKETAITKESILDALQRKALRYDKGAEEHYNTISAFIKSMRGSNPDAALYYMSRMLDAGEDPVFVARRMVVFASEDVGLADPQALSVAVNCFEAVRMIGMPECAINLAHGVNYLCLAPKSRASYEALREAQKAATEQGNLPIPLHLRNAPTKLMKELGYGAGYRKYNDSPETLPFLPEKLIGKHFLRYTKPKRD
jgi:putative ATPase